jgi:hypothetical protein
LSVKRPKSVYFRIALIIFILITGIVLWNHFKYKFVNRKLDNLVTGKSRGLYQINYRNLVIDEALGSLSVEDIEMIPDSEVYRTMQQNKTEPKDLFYIRIPGLFITGVKTPKALLTKQISAHMIRIENAEIEIRLAKSGSEKKTDFKKILNGDIYRQLLGNLKSIQADSIVLENASLTLTDVSTKKTRSQVTGLSIRFAGTLIDSTTQDDSTRILFSRELSIHCGQIFLPSKSKTYDFLIKDLDFNSASGSLHTGQIRLKPLLSETLFAKSHKFAVDRFDISLNSLDITQIDREAMLNEELIAGFVKMEGLSLHDFRDKSYPHDSVDRTHSYPQEAIMLLPFSLSIKKIEIANSFIEYKEKNNKSDSSGKVTFFHIRADLNNVTNMVAMIRRQNQMVLHFHALFLNTSAFEANISMRLNDKQGNFQLDAKLDTIGAESLNPLLEPMALARLDKGKITRLVYHLDGTNREGKGELDFHYEDLSVRLLKKDKEKNRYKTKGLPTLAAGLLVKRSNPEHGKTRTANVNFSRDIHRSIFNFMWKSLLSGIKQIAL